MDVAKKETKVLAVDFGASSGRVMLGTRQRKYTVFPMIRS